MKIKKILMLLIVILILLTSCAYAKYVYDFEEVVIELTRDKNLPICNVSYSTEEWTNENVFVTITCDKEIEQVSGFELSENKKVLTKEVTKNESQKVIITDIYGNCTEVEYSVTNIDKEPPKIIGCYNGEVYNVPLELNYSDNGEIKEISVDKYTDELIIEHKDIFYDCEEKYGIDRTATTLTVHVKEHPLNTRKYCYYLNDKLYTTTAETDYTYTGLEVGSQYNMKIQAIDENGNVLDEKIQSARTSYFNQIDNLRKDNYYSCVFRQVNDFAKKLDYKVLNGDTNEIIKNTTISHKNDINEAGFIFEFSDTIFKYIVEYNMYDENNELLDTVKFLVDSKSNYIENKSNLDIYNIVEKGNYQIKVEDFAGNETIYYIKVE